MVPLQPKYQMGVNKGWYNLVEHKTVIRPVIGTKMCVLDLGFLQILKPVMYQFSVPWSVKLFQQNP